MDDLRCSTITRAVGEDPGGTAAPWSTIILAELPLPWPDRIEAHPALAAVDVTQPGTRLLGLADSSHPGDSPTDRLRLLSYRRSEAAPFTAFARTTSDHAPADLALGVRDALEGPAPAAPIAGAAPPVDDLMVCTHGTRDRCCGKFGMELFNQICDRLPEDTGRWRTSHTGGHRFAPTALTLPDGCLWAHLDPELLAGIIERTTDPERAATHLRGSTGIGEAPAQLVDRAGLATHGWDWLGAERRAVTSHDGGSVTVDLHWSSPRLGEGTARAHLVAGDAIAVPPCGEPMAAASKATAKWAVGRVDWG